MDKTSICEKIQIAILSDEVLSDEQIKHIETCPECSALLSQVKEMTGDLSCFAVPDIEDGEIADRVMEKIGGKKQIPFPAPRLTRHLGTVASLLIICAMVLALRGNIPTSIPDTPIERTDNLSTEKSGFSVNGTFDVIDNGTSESGVSILSDTSEKVSDEHDAVEDNNGQALYAETYDTGEPETFADPEVSEQETPAPVIKFSKKRPENETAVNDTVDRAISTPETEETSPIYNYSSEIVTENDKEKNTAAKLDVNDFSPPANSINNQATVEHENTETLFSPDIPECSEDSESPSDGYLDTEDVGGANAGGGSSGGASAGGGSSGGGASAGGGGGSFMKPSADSSDDTETFDGIEEEAAEEKDYIDEYIFRNLDFLDGDENLEYNIALANTRLEQVQAGITITKELLSQHSLGNEFFTATSQSITLYELESIFS